MKFVSGTEKQIQSVDLFTVAVNFSPPPPAFHGSILDRSNLGETKTDNHDKAL